MKMRTLIKILLICFCLGFSSAYGSEKLSLAVLEFQSQTNIGELDCSFVSDRIQEYLQKTGKFKVVDINQTTLLSSAEAVSATAEAAEEVDYQKMGDLYQADVVIGGKVILEEKVVAGKSKEKSISPGDLFWGMNFPGLYQGSAKEEKEVRVCNISMTIKAFDVASRRILATETIPNATLSKIDRASRNIFLEIIKKYPIRGKILSAVRDQFEVDLGKNQGVSKYDVVEIYSPETVLKSGSETIGSTPEKKIGEMQILEIHPDCAIVKTIPGFCTEKVEAGKIIKIIPAEAFTSQELMVRKAAKPADPSGMGSAFVGQSSGAYAAIYNPAGMVQSIKPEIKLDWNLHYSSSGITVPNAHADYSIKDLYGDFNSNPVYPRQFCGILPYNGNTLGLNLGVSNQKIDANLFKFDDGEVELGLHFAKALHPDLMFGMGLRLFDRWSGSHRTVNSVDNSYQFRGSAQAVKAGLIYRPDSRLGIGAVMDIGTNYQGKLKTTGSAQSETDFSIAYPQNYGIGLSYKPWERMTCNLDLYYYPRQNSYLSRIGSEFYLTDRISLKGGLYEKNKRLPNFNSDPNYPRNYDLKSIVYTGGIGYASGNFSIDACGEYEVLREPNVLIYPDFTIGSQSRAFLDRYKEARVKVSVGGRF